jgi:4-diphosphocytidyl-2-C-methyl-D-erythritol kinase
MRETLCAESPAKINLRLEILKKRDDGYHELRTVFQKISLYDTLHFTLKKATGVTMTTDDPDLPVGKTNLVHRAVVAVLERSDYEGGVHIRLEKRIPLGGGLGGGSSDAAAALKAMNQLLGNGLSRKELMEIGKGIGADVPFFLAEGAAIGTGIGDRLRKIALPSLWYVLINPRFEVSTRWAYQNFVLTKRRFHLNIRKFTKTPRQICNILQNDLEEVVAGRYPQIRTMKGILSSVGALGVLMTGSGPTVFGIFPGEKDAREAKEKVKRMVRRKRWRVLSASGISV